MIIIEPTMENANGIAVSRNSVIEIFLTPLLQFEFLNVKGDAPAGIRTRVLSSRG